MRLHSRSKTGKSQEVDLIVVRSRQELSHNNSKNTGTQAGGIEIGGEKWAHETLQTARDCRVAGIIHLHGVWLGSGRGWRH